MDANAERLTGSLSTFRGRMGVGNRIDNGVNNSLPPGTRNRGVVTDNNGNFSANVDGDASNRFVSLAYTTSARRVTGITPSVDVRTTVSNGFTTHTVTGNLFGRPPRAPA